MRIFLLIVALCSIKTATSTLCFWNTGCPYKYFSNKTPYNLVRGDIRDSLVKITGCEPVSIWGLVRHGQRNPGTEFGKDMRAALVIRDHVASSYKRGNSSLCAQDVQNLEDWQLNADMFDKPFQLTKEGYIESKDIGRRLKEAFPKLLQNLERNDYQFRPAPGAWMADSAKAFVEGLSDKDLTIEPPSTGYDVLSPYDTCNKYINIKKDPKTYAEPANYMSSSDFLASMDRIQRRLGIGYLLTETNATALWDLCRYTSSGLTGTLSPWCALFTTEDLKVMEYIGDLRHYYRSGYGTSINELFGQITLTDLLKSFQDAKSGKGKKITTYVSHATMMDMVYTALKLFKDDEPLTGSLRKPDRKWRSSKQAVFSANLMVVLNKFIVWKNGTAPLVCEEETIFFLEMNVKVPAYFTSQKLEIHDTEAFSVKERTEVISFYGAS